MTIHRVFLAEDHALVRRGVRMLLAERPDFVVTGEAADGLELLRLLREEATPEIVIVDLTMPKLSGIQAIREIRRMNLNVKVLVFTMHKEEDYLCQAFLAGADGYLLKDEAARELFTALDTILGSKVYVSPILAREAHNTWLNVFIATKGAHPDKPLSPQEIDFLTHLSRGESGTRPSKTS